MARPPVRRFEVAEDSMLPALRPGDYLVAVRRRVRAGDVVVCRHPHRSDFWIVKRVESIDGRTAFLVSDNDRATRADSRTFGRVPAGELWRVVLRYWPPSRAAVRF